MRAKDHSFSQFNEGVIKYTQTIKKRLQKYSMKDIKRRWLDGFVCSAKVALINPVAVCQFRVRIPQMPEGVARLGSSNETVASSIYFRTIDANVVVDFQTDTSRKQSVSCLLGLGMWGKDGHFVACDKLCLLVNWQITSGVKLWVKSKEVKSKGVNSKWVNSKGVKSKRV